MAAKAEELKSTEHKAQTAESRVKRININLYEHAFDQSDNFVKIYIPFNHDKIANENVQAKFSESSFDVVIQTDDKNYQFIVRNLLKNVDVDKSYKTVKPDMVSVYLKKVNTGEKWECLTKTEKQLKDQKNKTFEQDKGNAGDDPMGGLLNIMKKMYDSGDSEMKRTIAKAWTEGQEKNRKNPMI